jgi:hypoxanthine-guanine phosphoribosyltransferase
MMKTDTAQKILDYTQQKGDVTAHELSGYLGLSPQAVFRQLAKLVIQNKLKKTGKPPKVFYSIALIKEDSRKLTLPAAVERQINENFYLITPSGYPMEGVEAFSFWCQKQALNIPKTAIEYATTLEKYHAFKKSGLIDGMKKFKSTFAHVYLDHIFYLDFYAIERFGKTKLGQLLLYAKQTQNRSQIFQLADTIKPAIERLLKEYRINAVGFIPPTVKRDVQLMKELQHRLNLPQAMISLVKIKTPVTVPQKTLNKLEDRIENAANTIIANEKQTYENILLIDDAVGSGATLNETARQIRTKGLCKGTLIGLAITGSFKGFDVISEV